MNCLLNTKTLNGTLSAKEFTKKSECHKIDITKTMLGMVSSSTYNHNSDTESHYEFVELEH